MPDEKEETIESGAAGDEITNPKDSIEGDTTDPKSSDDASTAGAASQPTTSPESVAGVQQDDSTQGAAGDAGNDTGASGEDSIAGADPIKGVPDESTGNGESTITGGEAGSSDTLTPEVQNKHAAIRACVEQLKQDAAATGHDLKELIADIL